MPKVLISNNFKNTANILAKNLARFNFIPCQIDKNNLDLADYKI
ncbi:hypothetical protein Halhy_0528 [Haliscomenobacter hydrossis DSM 1100]|uniref:Uncharacterized protein n=1 Tax=Haliscomenobacter hydrossis (strain ATCC 27775 / DSM 1100 / LMG 10767 / O) TaxID=760192 RepID=F4KZE3_HALH1|nr:hypothetical protein Halhy_0528 [Haliscomenobacter hydrossis DSM 1100]